MVGFDYYQNLEKECSSLYYSILSRGLLEEFDTFVPDRVLYEKLWHAFMHPYIGSYDNFFYVPERPKPKHPRFLEEKPSRGGMLGVPLQGRETALCPSPPGWETLPKLLCRHSGRIR